MPETSIDSQALKWGRLMRTFRLAVGFLVIAAIIAVIGPSFQSARSWRPSQSWKNLRQIGIALHNYNGKYGTLPYDPKGSEYALYLLSNDLSASCFDSHPHDKPKTEARWDHEQKRLNGSDFEYLNQPIDVTQSWRLIILAEVPSQSYQSIQLLLGDGRITYCKRPSGSSRDLLAGWETSDDFIVKDQKLYVEWEEVPLPRGVSERSESTSEAANGSIWGGRTIHRSIGSIDIDYSYRRGELVNRSFRSAEGKILDSVVTDELGRIVSFSRTPTEWKKFWPIKGE